jgi:ribonuclease HI
MQFDRQMNRREGRVKLVHVKAHSGIHGNDMADR